jgi:phage terminase large subunit GpA-like protein
MTVECVAEAWRSGWTPDPLLLVSEWADDHRKLGSKSSAEPGDWDTNRVPYAREPMDRLSVTDPTEMVVLMWGAQTSKTETGNNWTGYVVHHAPGPMMLVQPTVDMAKRLSKQRLSDMIEQTPALRERIAESRSRDSGNTLLSKEFPGGVLVLTGANSASGLRSMPARYLFLDEVDAYPLDVDDEGDPVSLAIKRTTTFGRRRKVLITSTPTVKDVSRVEKEYEKSDQRRYFMACPHCGHEQWLRWRGYNDDPDDPRAKEYRLVWLDEAKTAAGYKCGGDDCGALIEEFHKTKMLLGGQWRATAQGDGKTKGYQLSSLYSPLGWLSWVELLQEFEAAAHDVAQLKTFVNTRLAETWEDASTVRLDAEGLAARAGGYELGTVPEGGLVMTVGIDMQRRAGGYAQLVFRAWGAGDESWLVDRKIIYGDQFGTELWKQIRDAIDQEYPHASGASMRAYAAAIDSGDGETVHQVYAFARDNKKRHVLATKGMSQAGKPVLGTPTKQDVNIRKQKIKRGVDLWPIGSDTIKSLIHGRLQLDAPAGPGVIHWPAGLPDDYWKQITAEKQKVKLINGFPKRVWTKKDGDYNEDLDCEAMAVAALEYVKTRHNRATFWQQMRAQMAAKLSKSGTTPVQSAPDAPQPEAVGVPAATAAPPGPGRVSLSGMNRR